jgi:uncharacterized protein (TIGR03083 family)
MPDYAQAYDALRCRVTDLVRDASDEEVERHTPAAPEWRVRDVVAHLCGVAADVNAGNLDGVTTQPWTARQVDARRDSSIEQLLAEWETEAAKLEPLMSSMPDATVGQMLFDATTHEHDVRAGLDQPGARDSDAMALAFDWGAPGLAMTAEPADVTLRVETDAGTTTAGSGAREVAVRVEWFELFRAMTGRRSADQIRAFDWHGEPSPELLVFPIFTPRETPLVE